MPKPLVQIVMNAGCKGKVGDWIGVPVGRYEYLCVTYADYRVALASKYVEDLEAAGWRKAWADMQIDGAFVVFRRDLPGKE